MKNKKWKVSEVKEKEKKSYNTKAKRLARRKKEYIFIGMMLSIGMGVIMGFSNINSDDIKLNLKQKAQNDINYQLEYKNATESKNLTNFAMSEKFDPVKKDIIDVAQEKGFEDIGLLFHLAKYESNFDPYAIGINKHKSGVISLDRGIFQINHFYHPTISNECAFDVRCATNETINMIIRNGGCSAWTTCPY